MSTQGNRRNNKRKHEDNAPTYEQYLELKYGFLNSHAPICDICRSLIYGSTEESQLDYAYDPSSNSLTETQVGDMILGHLDMIYRQVINDLSSMYGYPEVDAATAVLATGICYGCEDPIGNALKHALTFLRCGLRVDKPKRQNFPEDLKTLVKFVSTTVYDGWKKKYPCLCMDDFLLWILIYSTDSSDASALASYSFGVLGRLKPSSNFTCVQCKEESTSSISTVQFMPVAGVNEDDELDPSSPHLENASKAEFISVTDIPVLASPRFTARTCLSLPSSNPNAAKEHPMSSPDSLLDKFSSLTISESSVPEEKSVNVNSKDADGSRSGFTHHRLERRRQAKLTGTARKPVNMTNRDLEITKNTMLDSNCSLPKPDKKEASESSQSFGTKNFSCDDGSFASSSFSRNIVMTTASLSHATNVDTSTSVQYSKSSSDISFKLDYSAGSFPCVLEALLSRSNVLELQLQYWTKWAHHKVLQVTNKLTKDKAVIQRLKQEKLEAKNEREAFANNTMKKIGEMEKALKMARTQVDVTNGALRKLGSEQTRLEEKLEAAMERASQSAANCQEATSKENMAFKKVQTLESERTLFQEELERDKRVLSEVQRQLQRAQMSHAQVEVITSWFTVCCFFPVNTL